MKPIDEPSLAKSISTDETPATMTLASGYTLESPDRASILHVRAPDGRICLRLTLLPEGPMVELTSASLSIASQGDVRVDCQRFEVQAREGMTLQSGKNIETRAEGEHIAEAFGHRVQARRGDVHLQANDDVLLDGERVRLNSPRAPAEIEDRRRRMAALLPSSEKLPERPEK